MGEQDRKHYNKKKSNSNRTHIPVEGYKVEDLQSKSLEGASRYSSEGDELKSKLSFREKIGYWKFKIFR